MEMEHEMEDNNEAGDNYTITMNSCRICLKTYDEPMCLIHERVRSISYAEMLRCVTRIKVTEDEELPDKICCKCRVALEKSFIFKVVAEKSDARLKLLKEIDHDFSVPLVKEEYLEDEEYENVNYSDDYEDVRDTKEEGDSNDDIHVKLEHYAEVMTEDEEIEYDSDYYKIENNEIKFETGLEENEVITALEENSHFANENNEKVAKRKGRTDKLSSRGSKCRSRGKSKSNQRKAKERQKHICSICGMQVTFLSQHMKSHNESVIQCPECPKTFHKRSNLRTHMKYHTGLKNYVCSVCGMSFYERRGLNRHSFVHTGVKPYSCELCEKTFVAGNSLKLHMEIHAGTKRYKCDVCGTHFRAAHQLKAHAIIHTGDKPYHCQICNVGFGYKVNLNNHVLKVHQVNLKFKSIHTFTQELLMESNFESEDQTPQYIEETNEDIDETVLVQQDTDQTVMDQEDLDQSMINPEEIDQTTLDQEPIEQQEQVLIYDSDEKVILSMVMPDETTL